jgi:hypothetical protein
MAARSDPRDNDEKGIGERELVDVRVGGKPLKVGHPEGVSDMKEGHRAW